MENQNPNISIPCENANPNVAKVQHVAKSSSDQLLSKFAEVGSEAEDRISAKKELRLAKRVKRSEKGNKFGSKSYAESNAADHSTGLADKKLLLPPPPAVAASRKSVALIRRLGMCKTRIRAKELKSKSILGAIEKVYD